VVVFYLLALLVAGALGLAQAGSDLEPQILSLAQFGPAVAAVVVLIVFPSLRSVVATTFGGNAGVGVRQVALVSGTTVVIFAGCLGVYAATGTDPEILPTTAVVAPLWLIVPAQLVGACGEELGWRCLLQPLFRRRWSPLVASAAVGLMWGAWHVQVFTIGASFAAAFLTSAVALSVVMGLAIDRAGGHNLAIAATFHLLINLGLLFLLDEENGDATAMWVFALMSAAVAGVWAVAHRRPRGRRTAVGH
jgi:membrane protease YdiL (CAAX protease family)